MLSDLELPSDGVLPRPDSSEAAMMSSSRTSDSGERHCMEGSMISVNFDGAMVSVDLRIGGMLGIESRSVGRKLLCSERTAERV